jgi:hypothetical protein
MIEYFTSAGECSLITIRQPTEESANLSESAKTQLVHGDEAFEFNVQLAVDLRLLPYAPYIISIIYINYSITFVQYSTADRSAIIPELGNNWNRTSDFFCIMILATTSRLQNAHALIAVLSPVYSDSIMMDRK